jgi:hypothetical protein
MKEFNHIQTAPSSTWIITHNLNSESVAVGVNTYQNGELTVTVPYSILYDVDMITIEFNDEQTGTARIVV